MSKEQQKQHLIDMMRSDEELGLCGETDHLLSTEANRNRLLCKDCNKLLENCTCIEDTIEFPKNDTSKVTRVEVIQHSPPYNGRAFTNYNAKDVEIQFQDDGKTLKIFLI